MASVQWQTVQVLYDTSRWVAELEELHAVLERGGREAAERLDDARRESAGGAKAARKAKGRRRERLRSGARWEAVGLRRSRVWWLLQGAGHGARGVRCVREGYVRDARLNSSK